MKTGIAVALSFLMIACCAKASPGKIEKNSTPKTELVISSATPTSFRPDQIDIDSASETFARYFDLLAAGSLAEAYSMQSDSQKRQMNFETWKMRVVSGLTGSAEIEVTHIARITWYPDPPSGPLPGLYVAIDYVFWGKADDFQCGHIVLHSTEAKKPTVSRTDQTFISSDMMENDFPTEEVLKQLPCYLGPDIKTAFGNINN